MWDRYDPRSTDSRDRGDSRVRSRGSSGGMSARDRNEELDPREVFTKDLTLPRGRQRELVRARERVSPTRDRAGDPGIFRASPSSSGEA
jgi:hypothetical protein